MSTATAAAADFPPPARRRRDKAWREAEARLGWVWLVALGRAGETDVMLRVVDDVHKTVTDAQVYHAVPLEVRMAVCVVARVWGEVLRDAVLEAAAGAGLRRNGSWVGMEARAVAEAVMATARAHGVGLYSAQAYERAVETEMGR